MFVHYEMADKCDSNLARVELGGVSAFSSDKRLCINAERDLISEATLRSTLCHDGHYPWLHLQEGVIHFIPLHLKLEFTRQPLFVLSHGILINGILGISQSPGHDIMGHR